MLNIDACTALSTAKSSALEMYAENYHCSSHAQDVW